MPRTLRSRSSSPPLAFIPPLKPTLSSRPPEGGEWLHEVKHDGYRTELIVDAGAARAFTMNGHDWTARYPDLVAAAAKLKCRSAIIDGEAVVQDENGVSSFGALRSAIASAPHRIVLFAFDLLHLDGMDLRRLPLVERRARLEQLLGRPKPAGPIQFSEALEGSGAKIFAAASDMGLEGIVSKRKASAYVSGVSHDWLKTKAMVEEDFVVVGMEPNPGGPPYALLAREEEGRLSYAGSAFVTLPKEERDAFWEAGELLRVRQPAVKEIRRRKASFVKPLLRVRARHLKGGGPMLRHASLTEILTA